MQAPLLTTHSRLACRLATGLALACMLAACGYKGPLYMPPPPAPDESLTQPPPPATPLGAEVPNAGNPASATPSPVQ